MSGKLWTASEDATLRAVYLASGIAGAAAALGRTRSSVIGRAYKLNLDKKRRWSDVEDAKLRMLWDGETPIAEMAATLDRTEHAVYFRAHALDLPLGAPEGWEHLTHAAERAGYTTAVLRKILRANGVVPRLSISPRAGRVLRSKHRVYIVWPHDVDDAVRAWMDTETVNAAARRAGMCRESLKRRLEAVGVKRRKNHRRYKHWRVSAADVERALAGERAA